MKEIIPYRQDLKELARQLRQNMTLSEVLLWKEIKNRKLGVRFSRQIPLDRFIVDFYCKDLKLAIEIDGHSHYHAEIAKNDIIRQKRLESFGVIFLRFDDLDVKKNMSWVLEEIEVKVKRLQPTPVSPPGRGLDGANKENRL